MPRCISLAGLDLSFLKNDPPPAGHNQPPKIEEPHPGRSDVFAVPHVIGAMREYQSMIDGSMITDRAQHREHLKKHGCVEVGNEKPVDTRALRDKERKASIKTDLKQAYEAVSQGYVPPPLEKADVTVNPYDTKPVIRDGVMPAEKSAGLIIP